MLNRLYFKCFLFSLNVINLCVKIFNGTFSVEKCSVFKNFFLMIIEMATIFLLTLKVLSLHKSFHCLWYWVLCWQRKQFYDIDFACPKSSSVYKLKNLFTVLINWKKDHYWRYSLKTILIPDKRNYELQLIEKIELFT